MADEVEARVIGAFEQAAGLGAIDNRYLHMAKAVLQMYGEDLVAAVRVDERVALGVPIQPFVDGKTQPGAILLLEHRALVIWAVGTFKPTTTLLEFELDGSLEVTTFRRKAGRLSSTMDGVRIATRTQRVEFLFYSNIQEDRLTNFVTMNLNGVMTFNWDEPAAT